MTCSGHACRRVPNALHGAQIWCEAWFGSAVAAPLEMRPLVYKPDLPLNPRRARRGTPLLIP